MSGAPHAGFHQQHPSLCPTAHSMPAAYLSCTLSIQRSTVGVWWQKPSGGLPLLRCVLSVQSLPGVQDPTQQGLLRAAEGSVPSAKQVPAPPHTCIVPEPSWPLQQDVGAGTGAALDVPGKSGGACQGRP